MNKEKDKTPLLVHGSILILFYLIAKSASKFRDVTDALGFYGVYHREPWNQVIHFFGVPAILWSLFVFLAHVPLPFPHQSSSYKRMTYAEILVAFYFLFYLKIDPVGDICYAYDTSSIPSNIAKNMNNQTNMITKSRQTVPNRYHSLKIAACIHFLGWYIQIHPGHYIIEGAVPAITQSFGSALTSAPLFAFYEGLWFLGIRKTLQIQTLILVDQYTRTLCMSGKPVVLRACSSINVMDASTTQKSDKLN